MWGLLKALYAGMEPEWEPLYSGQERLRRKW